MLAYVKNNDLSNTLVEDRISKEAIPALLRMTDICLAHCSSEDHEQSFKYGISKNKVNEYLYSNACVIYGRNDPNDPVASSGAGFIIKPFDASQFAKQIENVYLMTDDERKLFGENGRKYINDNHRVDILVTKLLDAFNV